MNPSDITFIKIQLAYGTKKYPLDLRLMFVNVFGIRSADSTPDTFNDIVGFACATTSGWLVRAYRATTDPGLFYLRNPMNTEGTGIVVPGHYPDSHVIGKHKGQYTALVQSGPVKMYRDKNKDDKFDMTPENIVEGTNFGMNIHRANPAQASTVVDKWSAACQVVAGPNNFEELIGFCLVHKALYENKFSYTLFDQKEVLS